MSNLRSLFFWFVKSKNFQTWTQLFSGFVRCYVFSLLQLFSALILNHLSLSTWDNAISHHPKSIRFNSSLKSFVPYPVHQHKNVGIFSGFLLFSLVKRIVICVSIVFVFLGSPFLLSVTQNWQHRPLFTPSPGLKYGANLGRAEKRKTDNREKPLAGVCCSNLPCG